MGCNPFSGSWLPESRSLGNDLGLSFSVEVDVAAVAFVSGVPQHRLGDGLRDVRVGKMGNHRVATFNWCSVVVALLAVFVGTLDSFMVLFRRWLNRSLK